MTLPRLKSSLRNQTPIRYVYTSSPDGLRQMTTLNYSGRYRMLCLSSIYLPFTAQLVHQSINSFITDYKPKLTISSSTIIRPTRKPTGATPRPKVSFHQLSHQGGGAAVATIRTNFADAVAFRCIKNVWVRVS